MRDQIIAELKSMQDKTYRDFHSGLCPGTVNIIGVRIPAQRKIAQRLVRDKTAWQQYLTEVQNKYYEETMIEGIIIAAAKISMDERLRLLKTFVPKIDNWAVCDSVCASFKLKLDERALMWRFILQYQQSPREFELRFMLIMMLDHFLDDEHIAEIVRIISQLRLEDYYVKMAVAWLVAEMLVQCPEPAWRLLKNHILPTWVHNKAVQKACESFRVSSGDKSKLRALKVDSKGRK